VEGFDLLDIFEQYFRESEQLAARLVEHSPTRFSMVLALPDADDDWVARLEPDEVAKLADEGEPLDECEFVFRCGCDPERVGAVMARMFAGRADEFFRGKPVVEAICPRCGARHLLDRQTFDRQAGSSG
jgi:redox-regulated HSP33 family molecular chaperone